MEPPKVVSQEEWLEARRELLEEEKTLTREREPCVRGLARGVLAQHAFGFLQASGVPLVIAINARIKGRAAK